VILLISSLAEKLALFSLEDRSEQLTKAFKDATEAISAENHFIVRYISLNSSFLDFFFKQKNLRDQK